MSSYALDASLLIAVFTGEPDHEQMTGYLLDGVVSSVNLSEVAAKLGERGEDEAQFRRDVREMQLPVVAFDEELAFLAARLRGPTRHAGLSFADRACLATARSLGLTAVTADRGWKNLKLGIRILVVR